MAKTKRANLPVPYRPQAAKPAAPTLPSLAGAGQAIARGLARMFAPRAAISESDPIWADLLNGGWSVYESNAGANVSSENAMGLAVVYACVRLLSQTIAMLPLRLYERDGDRETIAEGHPVDRLLWLEPNRWQTPFEFKQMLAAHVALGGNMYAFVSRRGGEVQEIVPLHPRRMEVRQEDDLFSTYHYTTWAGHREDFVSTEILHWRGLTTDGIMGLSPVKMARNAIGLTMQQEKHAAFLFRQGAQPIGFLKTDRQLTQEAAKKLRERFDAAFAGVDNSHRTVVLEEGMDWVKSGFNAEETQFLQSRKYMRNELAMYFGIPPHMIGDVEKSTSWGSGIEQQGIGFLTYTLRAWLTSLEETINRDMLRYDEKDRFFAQFDTSPLTRGDFKSRVDALISLRNNGGITTNELRKDLSLNPLDDEGADRLVTSSNTVYLDSAQVREGINRTANARPPAKKESK